LYASPPSQPREERLSWDPSVFPAYPSFSVTDGVVFVASRVLLDFAPGLRVRFTDRERGLERIRGFAERGTSLPVVIYGPEGSGKTALLRQAIEVLREHGYEVIYIDALAESLGGAVSLTPGIHEALRGLLRSLVGERVQGLVEAVSVLVREALRRLGRPRLAVLLDDVFQAIGLGRVEAYVKQLLNLIEYPGAEYDRLVVMATSSEGRSRLVLSRHVWSMSLYLWNMDREGLSELYEQLPGDKPGLDTVWRVSGGNPRVLRVLYTMDWSIGDAVAWLVEEKSLATLLRGLQPESLEALRLLVEDPGAAEERVLGDRELLGLLVDHNLVSVIPERRESLWLDNVPPARDKALGIGGKLAWQTPLHRDAVAYVLQRFWARTASG